MSTLQGVLHISVAIHQAGWHLKRNLQIYGLLAFSGIALAVITHLLRRVAIEILSKVHKFAAVLVGITVLCHLIQSRIFPKLGVLISSIAISLLLILRWVLLLIRNIKYAKVASRAVIVRMKHADAIRVVIPINRPFQVQPGMSVYIWMPGVSLRSALQTYSFPISWWENDINGNATSITLLVREKRGFAQRLMNHPRSEFLTWLDGPYGRLEGLAGYSRVLCIGTGIGIAPLLSYIRLSVESNINNHTHCDIFIVWEVDHESNFDWIYDWMDELLRKDNGAYKLHFALHIPSARPAQDTHETWNSKHGRIFRLYSAVNAKDAIPNDFFEDGRKGLIAVCAEESIVAELYGLVAHQMTGLVNIVDLQFQSAGIGGSTQASAPRKFNSAENGGHDTQIKVVSI
ncbi:hypothetical protein N7471_008353 [Penicillium samsonianum]|uniref:uncharacterized protein n=1 Tax=Penicillium samsonianum TaxID=1882272 RepID=UPI002548723D|nr:uncharacterized protein N7471_008353 [Penicillium samsonianum]KAJ6133138.1 hypothetical protein N7471_008353 [Penicillium samsonianum]